MLQSKHGYYVASMFHNIFHYNMLDVVAVPFSLVVRIPGFHPGGLGSIPGMGTFKKIIIIHFLCFASFVLEVNTVFATGYS